MMKKTAWRFVCVLMVALLCVGTLGAPAAGRAAELPDVGDNLLADGGRERTGAGFVSIKVRDDLQDQVDRQVTVSFDIKGREGQNILVYAYQDSGISIFFPEKGKATLRLEKDDEYMRYSLTGVVRDFGQQYSKDGKVLSEGALAFYDTAEEKQPISVRQVKIERGETATEWSLNPNDPNRGRNLLSGWGAARTAVNGFTQVPTRDVLGGFVGYPISVSFDCQSPVDGRLLVYPYQGSGVSMENSVTVDVKAGDFVRYTVQSAVKDYGQQQSKEGKDLSAGSIGFYTTTEGMDAFVIRRVKIELGHQPTDWSFAPTDPMAGRNLLLDSARERTSAGGFLQIPAREMLKDLVGSQITMSFDIKGDTDAMLLYPYQSSGISIAAQPGDNLRFGLNGRFRRYTFTVDVKDYGQQQSKEGKDLSAGSIALYNQAADHGDFVIRNIKVELGSQATAWSVAPDDPACVSGAEQTLAYLRACRAKNTQDFSLFPDEATFSTLSANRFFELRRLMAQAGYALSGLLDTRNDHGIAIRKADLAPVDCAIVETKDELTDFFKEAAEKKLTAFTLILNPDLYATLSANFWKELSKVETDAGVTRGGFSYYADYAVLCYEDFRSNEAP